MTYIHTHTHTDRISAFVTKEGLASLAPITNTVRLSESLPSRQLLLVEKVSIGTITA